MTVHQVVHRTIPQMRTPPVAGPHALTVRTVSADRIGCLEVRGAAGPEGLDPLLTALDTVFGSDVHGVVLDCTGVTDWSRRGLEVGVLTATRARSLRIAFAVCGLPEEQLAVLRREWPGIRSERFAFPDRAAALAAVHHRVR